MAKQGRQLSGGEGTSLIHSNQSDLSAEGCSNAPTVATRTRRAASVSQTQTNTNAPSANGSSMGLSF